MGDDIFPDELYHDIITDQQQKKKFILVQRKNLIRYTLFFLCNNIL